MYIGLKVKLQHLDVGLNKRQKEVDIKLGIFRLS